MPDLILSKENLKNLEIFLRDFQRMDAESAGRKLGSDVYARIERHEGGLRITVSGGITWI